MDSHGVDLVETSKRSGPRPTRSVSLVACCALVVVLGASAAIAVLAFSGSSSGVQSVRSAGQAAAASTPPPPPPQDTASEVARCVKRVVAVASLPPAGPADPMHIGFAERGTGAPVFLSAQDYCQQTFQLLPLNHPSNLDAAFYVSDGVVQADYVLVTDPGNGQPGSKKTTPISAAEAQKMLGR
jgi:hypothetical protein